MRIFKHWDGPDPGATPGRVFTASIGQEQLTNAGAFLDHLNIGLNGAVSTAAVVIETFAGLLSEFDFWVGPDLRIKANASDLIALAALYNKELPMLGENSDGTGNDFIGGIRVPIQTPSDPGHPFSMAATRTAQTNIGTEIISVTGHWFDQNYGRKPIHAVVVTFTSNASAGDEIKDFRIAPVGRLIGMVLSGPRANDFADGNIDISAQRVKLLRDSQAVAELNTLGDAYALEEVNFVSLSIYGDLISAFKRYDFRPEGFDLKSGIFSLKFDNEDVSDAMRFMPVIEME